MALSSSAAAVAIEHKIEERVRRHAQKLAPRGVPRHKNRALEIRIDDTAVKVLRELIEWHGIGWMEEQVELSSNALYRLMAGFAESARPQTIRRVKEFLAGYYA